MGTIAATNTVEWVTGLPIKTDDFPIPVSEDYGKVVEKADKLAFLVDRHLEFESKLQGRQLRPVTLCPEQKVELATDMSLATE